MPGIYDLYIKSDNSLYTATIFASSFAIYLDQ